MSKIKSLEELKALNIAMKSKVDLRNNAENPDRIVIAVGMATCGIAAGARAVLNKLNEEILKNNLSNVSVMATGCLGFCYAEPMVEVRFPNAEPILYGNIDEAKASQIIHDHIIGGKLLDNTIIGRSVGGL